MIKLAALAAGLNSEPQNNEYRISKDGIASLNLFKTDRMHSFDVHQFLSRSDWPLFRPATWLTPEPIITFCTLSYASVPPQRATHNAQLVTRNQHPVSELKLLRRKGNHVINFSYVAKQHYQTIDSQCIAAGIRHVF